MPHKDRPRERRRPRPQEGPPRGSTRATSLRFDWGKALANLERFYSQGNWRVPVLRERRADPYRVLISTVLSHRSRDELTLKAFNQLMARYPTSRALAKSDLRTVARAIRPVGLSDSKAEGIRSLARAIEREHGGHVPLDYDELLELPLVGPKTASAVLVFGFERAAIPVDSHIHRVVNRLGVVRTSTPEETQRALQRVVPERYWTLLNPILVQHGQNICSAREPRCGACPIALSCSTGKAASRRGRAARSAHRAVPMRRGGS